jgi:ATP-dependent RNA helicase DDX3X
LQIIYVDEANKRQCLFDLLMVTPPARTIIFVNSKMSADLLDDFLYNRGLPSTSIHSDRTQREREDAL